MICMGVNDEYGNTVIGNERLGNFTGDSVTVKIPMEKGWGGGDQCENRGTIGCTMF